MGNSVSSEEIIIKCPLEEMVKHFFKDYVIVWHDPNVDSQENQKYMAQLKKFCEVLTFTEWEKASAYVQETKASCHMITSGTNGDLLVKEIYMKESVVSIYVFCRNREKHVNWAKNYQKVSCVETQLQEILARINENLLDWYKQASSLKLSLPAFAPIFNDSDKSEMNHLHRFLKVIPSFKNREQAKIDFISLSKGIYSDEKNVNFIASFEAYYNEYNKEQILRWYTAESFLYKVTNNCLRIATSDSIQYCRLLLKDIEMAIKDEYHTKSKDFNGLLYRGAYLSQEEWASLKENVDNEIEMHGFLSVSKVKNVAVHFMQTDPSKKVLITIIVPKGPNTEEQGFAEIEKYSRFPQEKEILFNVRSRFTVLEAEDASQDVPYRHLVLLYGARGFRKFISEENPVQEIAIGGNLSCVNCSKMTTPGEMLFRSLNEQICYCKKCAMEVRTESSPFLYVPLLDNKGEIRKIKGCFLLNSSETQLPFYGYKCGKCQTNKQKCYFTCSDCGEKEKRWCEDCFEDTLDCLHAKHNILLETNPFTFWCQKMSESELNHMKFQNSLVHDSDPLFQQAEMYFQSHEYEKAIEYYKAYIHQNEAKGKNTSLATSLNNVGQVYNSRGEYSKALECYLESLEIEKSLYGKTYPSIASSLNNIANIYYKQGDYNKALGYYLKALEINISAYGENHPHVATSYSNLGVAYKNKRDFKRALGNYLKALEIRKSGYGENHPEVGICYTNIGKVYYEQGDSTKALEYYEKSLEIYKAVYGENHPDVANSYNDIGMVYDAQENEEKAQEYYQKSLDIKKMIYGENHPEVAISYNNLGNIYHEKEKFERGLEYYLKALEIQKSVHGGENHPDIAKTLNNIGNVYCNQGDLEKGLEFHLKSLKINKEVHGENHPIVATSLNSIGNLYYGLEEFELALDYCTKSLQIEKKIHGENHPNLVISYKSIGLLYDNIGEFNKALEYFTKGLEIGRLAHGENHANVASSYNNIGGVYYKQGQYHKALGYFMKSLEIHKKVHGEKSSDVATSYNNIGHIYMDQGDFQKALEFMFKALEIEKGIYGEIHPNVAGVYASIGGVYCNQGDFKKGLEYQLKSLEIEKAFYGENHPQGINAHEMILELTSSTQ